MEITKPNKKILSDLAGTWTMSDSEADEFLKNLKREWNRWRIKTV